MKVLSHHVARSKFGAESETESIDNVGADEGHGGGTCLEHLWASQPFSLILLLSRMETSAGLERKSV